AVVRLCDLLAGQCVHACRDALGLCAIVHEDECGAGVARLVEHELRDRRPYTPVHLREIRNRRLHRQEHFLGESAIHDRNRAMRAAEEAGYLVERTLRSRQADSLRTFRVGSELNEALHRDRQVRTTLGACDSVYLVQDYRACGREHSASPQRRQHDVERFRRRDEDVRRFADHALALARRRVACAYRDAYLGKGEPSLLEPSAQLGQRPLQIALDVVVERLERRDVQQMHAVRERCREPLDDQCVQLPEERSQGLSSSRRREYECVVTTRDYRPSLNLWWRRRAQSLGEPFADYGMEVGQGIWR